MSLRNLGNTCVVGLQWGDEGKGKVVDLLVPEFDLVVRFAGGANAGHTVVCQGEKFALHQLPSGVLHRRVLNVIAGGTVIDPATLLGEIDSLRARGIVLGENLRISDRAHLVFPYHRHEDVVAERSARGEGKLGTTARGIGPCYGDKVARRWGIRICDLYRPDAFRVRLSEVIAHKTAYFSAAYESRTTFDAAGIADEYQTFAEQIRPFVCDTTVLLHERLSAGQRILFEGAQGCLLDIDHGTYPYVTSSSTTGFSSNAGVPAAAVQSMVGVVKAYSTRVGAGPFPTELDDEVGETIRRRGNEFGTTTGRPRRCGWFDAVAVGYAAKIAGPTHLAIMHLDTLAGMSELKICVAYRIGNRLTNDFPADPYTLAEVEPVYETLPGWAEDIAGCRRLEDLPPAARAYAETLARRVGVPVRLVGVGAEREQTIFVDA